MKKSITCRGIDIPKINENIIHTYTPKAGDIALFEVLSIGKHDSIQSSTGHNCYLFEGDLFMGAFGSRYATEQFEGYVPSEPTLELDILGKGGVVGVMHSMHYAFKDIGTTRVRLIGYATNDADEVINTKYYHKPRKTFAKALKPANTEIILSLGCSMDSGKTTTAGFLSRALSTKGKTVAYIKMTGTHYTKDRQFVEDCGASLSLDFGNAGFPSTYMIDIEELMDLYQFLLDEAAVINPDYIVVEIADGILQRETEMLLRYAPFVETIDNVIFSAVDSLSALYGIDTLTKYGLPPFAVCGLFTASPLLHKEVEARTSLPVLNLKQLENLDLSLLTNKHQYAN